MMAPEVPSAFAPASASAGGQAGSVAGGVRLLLRIEGAAAFAAALALYAHGDFSLAAIRGALPCARSHDAWVSLRAARRRSGV
jgi:hypothetical protein